MLWLGLFDWMGRRRGYLFLARDLQGWRKDNVLRLPQLRRSFNPSAVEGFFLGLNVVSMAHNGDLRSKYILGLGYADIVAVLLNLSFLLFSFDFVFLNLHSGFFSLILKLFGLVQLLLQSCHLLFGSSQLLFSLVF